MYLADCTTGESSEENRFVQLLDKTFVNPKEKEKICISKRKQKKDLAHLILYEDSGSLRHISILVMQGPERNLLSYTIV